MRNSCLILGLIAASVSTIGQVGAAEKPSAAAVLIDGTPVRLKVPATSTPATVLVGYSVELTVAEAVIVNGATVISTNNVANAVVSALNVRVAKTEANKVQVNLRSVSLVDGERVQLRIQHQVQLGLPAETVTSS